MCSLLRESKKNYFVNLSEKTFQKTNAFENRQTLFVKAIHFPERINLTEEENNSLLSNCSEVAKNLNNFFVNAAKNLNIPIYENFNSLAENPTLKAIVKCRKHPSILDIVSEYKNKANFSFNFVSKVDFLAEIKVPDI